MHVDTPTASLYNIPNTPFSKQSHIPPVFKSTNGH